MNSNNWAKIILKVSEGWWGEGCDEGTELRRPFPTHALPTPGLWDVTFLTKAPSDQQGPVEREGGGVDCEVDPPVNNKLAT